MKLMKYQPVVITEEIKLANLLAGDGLPVITHWYEPTALFYSADKNAVRNRASTDFWTRQEFSDFPAKHAFVSNSLVETQSTSIDIDIDFTEYTVFAVGKVDTTSTASSLALFGTPDRTAVVNTPCLIYRTSSKDWRVFGATSAGVEQIRFPMATADASQLNLYTLTRSESGVTLRVNGVKVGESASVTAVAQTDARKCRLLGYDFSSGAFSGSVGNIIMCRKDLTSDALSLQKIENFLMEKYAITP